MVSTPGTVLYPTALDDADSLIRAANNAASTLAAPLLAADTTATLTSVAAFPASGSVSLSGGEILYYTGKGATTLTGLVRAREGTTAVASLAAGTRVELRATARHHTVLADAIVATQTKIGGGASSPVAGQFLAGNGAGTSAWVTPTKSDVGLGNVDNTADANKPVSTAQQAAIDAAKARSVHTGTQLAATISDFSAATAAVAQVGYGLFVASGLTTDGTGDNTAAILAAITAIQAAGGGELRLPEGTIRCDGLLTVPNDGEAIPTQKPITIVGAGASKESGTASTGIPNGGTILDLRYSGAAAAKFLTLGSGNLVIRNLSITDKSATPNTVPFLLTTSTVLDLDGVSFFGNPARSGTACDQDAIILGGTTTTIDGTTDSPFQGYGTVIRNCHFDRIRRALYGRVYCNDTKFIDNVTWTKCGSNLSDGAAVEFYGDASDVCSGNTVQRNTFELNYYPHAVKITNGVHNTIGPNGLFDPTATHLAGYKFDTGAGYNMVTDGYRNDAYPLIREVQSVALTNRQDAAGHQSQYSAFTQPVRFYNETQFMDNPARGPRWFDSAGNQHYWLLNPGANPYPLVNLVTVAATLFADGVTTSGSATVTSATAAFATTDVGLPISGTGIPAYSKITKRNSATSVEISNLATITNTGVSIGIGRSTGASLTMTGFGRHHIISTGSAPGGAIDTAAGSASGGTFALSGTDLAHTITLTTGSSVTNGSTGTPVMLCHWAPALNFTAAPKASLVAKNTGAAQLVAAGVYLVLTATTMQLWCIGTVPVSTACIFDVLLIQ